LLAIAAVITRIAALRQVVFVGQALEVGAGQIVKQEVVIELEERAESFFDVVFDGALGAEELIECALEAILGDSFVRDAEEIVESGGLVPVLGEGELAAGLTEAVDDFDGHDVGGRDGFFALGEMLADAVIEADELPEPACQPDIAELSGVGPADVAEADADNVGVIGQGNVVVVGEEAELLRIAVAVVEDDGALPAAFLIVIEFAEVSDDALPRSGLGADAFDEGVVGVDFALFRSLVTSQEHLRLLDTSMVEEAGEMQRGRFPLHRQNVVSTTGKPRNSRTIVGKIV
jgi:hypothetical protein